VDYIVVPHLNVLGSSIRKERREEGGIELGYVVGRSFDPHPLSPSCPTSLCFVDADVVFVF
jgi:hypothetical protein